MKGIEKKIRKIEESLRFIKTIRLIIIIFISYIGNLLLANLWDDGLTGYALGLVSMFIVLTGIRKISSINNGE